MKKFDGEYAALINRMTIFAVAYLVLSHAVFADESVAQAIQGEWVINAAASDTVKEKYAAFEAPRRGGFRNGGIGTSGSGRIGPSGASRRGPVASSEPDEHAMTASMRKIISAEALRIEGREDLAITYNGKFTRKLVPNPGGRIYSASGDELVEDEFGYTLSYWNKNVLVVETTTQESVDIVERYRYDPEKSRLTVTSSVTPSGHAGIKIVRVFVRGDS